MYQIYEFLISKCKQNEEKMVSLCTTPHNLEQARALLGVPVPSASPRRKSVQTRNYYHTIWCKPILL